MGKNVFSQVLNHEDPQFSIRRWQFREDSQSMDKYMRVLMWHSTVELIKETSDDAVVLHFVRNPYDMVQSGYFYAVSSKAEQYESWMWSNTTGRTCSADLCGQLMYEPRGVASDLYGGR